ncbi:DNA-deoxyinosine glycosylase [Vogesella facilis]|uniref:DNA-deoxyinosine glycosylase n=1 Tax=Vogesella facilis TaxID=1655232 RepID=A0ABV7RIB5_9NEIS
MRKSSFPPVVAADTRLLILGSLPGEASLQAGQYYAHPRNQFWRLMAAVTGSALPALDYPQRLAALQAHGVGLWDVVADAQRRGSLDADIREARYNPLLALLAELPALRAVAFNGKTAGRAQAQLAGCGVELLVLPSSSPALTTAFDKKLEEWQRLVRYIS